MSYSYSTEADVFPLSESYGVSSMRSSGGAMISGGVLADSYGASSASYGTGGSVSYGGASYGSSGARNSTGAIARDLLEYASAGGSASYAGASSAGASYGAGARVAGSAVYLSEVEQAILRSLNPIESSETEELTINGQRGLWLNKSEVINWRGVIPLTQYVIHQDSNPEIITKRSAQVLEYVQELAIRYLRPPTPPAPGEIVINQEANTATPPAPPLVLRQQPPRPSTPEPLIVREAPPQPPPQIGRKVVTISGKRLPPPPRKVVIERLAALPSKPQSVIIERWLPYSEVKRRVIFNRNNVPDPVVVTPRNVIVQWEAPKVNIRKEIKYLGVVRANPAEYVQRYGSSLLVSRDLPQFVVDIKAPNGLVLAANYQYKTLLELEGDVGALKLVDLDREGLGEYRTQVSRWEGSSYAAGSSAVSYGGASSAGYYGSAISASSASNNAQLVGLVDDLFRQVDRDGSGKISISEAEKLVLRLNSRLGRSYGESDVKNFFLTLDYNQDGVLSLDEFRSLFFQFLA